MQVVLEIDELGDVHGLYTDSINLFSVGRIVNITKASNVEFNIESQVWEVATLNGQVVYEDKNREKAIEWEVENFSCGGCHYTEPPRLEK